jgi:DegV family protein with EDD domain
MPEPVAVVTDSTAYLPVGVLERFGVRVVPLQVVMAGRAMAEDDSTTGAQVAQQLAARAPVTTSRPAPATFVNVYRELASTGRTAVVSVHLSGELSGTVDAARIAARQVADEGTRVTVVDSRSLAMGLGFAVCTAARLAGAGADAARIALAAARRAFAGTTVLCVDTLEFLRRGGRIGTAQAVFGSALSVRPILHLVDGKLELLERVRTRSRARARLEEILVAEAESSLESGVPVDIAVHHLAAVDLAQEMADRLRERLPDLRELHVQEVGPVIGAHVGPGMLGGVVSPDAVGCTG